MATGLIHQLTLQLEHAKAFFDRATSALEEADSTFAPTPEMFTVAQQVGHVAQDIDWFREGASRPEGFEMDFERNIRVLSNVVSLKAAREWHDQAQQQVLAWIADQGEEGMRAPLPPGLIMGGAPRLAIVNGIVDHTAHHRGALAVYARLLGKVPANPYLGGEAV